MCIPRYSWHYCSIKICLMIHYNPRYYNNLTFNGGHSIMVLNHGLKLLKVPKYYSIVQIFMNKY